MSVAWLSRLHNTLVFCFALSIMVGSGCTKRSDDVVPAVISDELRALSTVPAPEGAACAQCHPKEFAEWRDSQHANANRLVNPQIDSAAFAGHPSITQGGAVTVMKKEGDQFTFTYAFSNESPRTYTAEAVIGITPLRQYLVSFPGGRLQTMDISYDPRSNAWFNAFPDVRVPGDWGHWTGRSMTWNVQCAFCHMTGFEKNYDPAKDTYSSTWKAMGISCSQCHTLKEKVSVFGVQSSVDTNECPMVEPFVAGPQQAVTNILMENCASCHARREELFGTFKPGDRFDDHFRLMLPDRPGVFHADGQVLDEDFEYASFMMSRMGHKGVTCFSCHNPHSGKLVAPVENNALCMQCHIPPGLNGAIAINPETHQFHTNGTPGGRCVDCHMPENTYMVRDRRRDHGFTSPDPRLTIELGIPNACNRCHDDKTPEWSEEWTTRWYGDRMDRRARHRARAVAAYHAGSSGAVTGLLAMARTEEIDLWRAALVSMLGAWNHDPAVVNYLGEQVQHTNARVRSAAINALSDNASINPSLTSLRSDTSALVRIDAALATLSTAQAAPAYSDVMNYVNHISDQPAGALRQANVALVEGRTNDVLSWTMKMIAWDPSSASRYMAGRLQFAAGFGMTGITNMLVAANEDKGNAEYAYSLSLALGELQYAAETLAWLEETVRRDKDFGRAWYNLGLAYAANERLDEAIKALRRAEALLSDSGDPSFALATVHLRKGDVNEAINAARLALAREPNHGQARQLLRDAESNVP